MELVKDLKPLVDLGVTGVLLVGLLFIVVRPPRWIDRVVESHHKLAEGVAVTGTSMSAMAATLREIPRRDEFQELLIGQEALRRETTELRDEIRDVLRKGSLRG